LKTTAVGIASEQMEPGVYTAAKSQRIPERMQQSCTGCGGRASFFIWSAST